MNSCNIKCRWADLNKYLVNPDGQVFPCCYLSNVYYFCKRMEALGEYDKLPDGHKMEINQHLLTEYDRLKDENNIFKNNIEDILSGEWFTKILPESWESEETLHAQCKRICTDE